MFIFDTFNSIFTLSIKDLRNLKVNVNYTGPLKAPIKKDQELGKLIIELGDELKEYPVYSSNKVKKVNFFKSLFLSFNYMIWGDV